MTDDTMTRTVEAIARMEARIAELTRERDAARAELASVRAAALEVLNVYARQCHKCKRPATCSGHHSVALGWLRACDACRDALRLVDVCDLWQAAAVRVICAEVPRG